jgi:hypothetical protein
MVREWAQPCAVFRKVAPAAFEKLTCPPRNNGMVCFVTKSRVVRRSMATRCALARRLRGPATTHDAPVAPPLFRLFACALDSDASASYALSRPVCYRHGVVL